ncbi:hypothetical protein HIM_11771 [Hirsutella minnesotensis 3608]|uniref:GmrSD restriction endonucleases C-terminal domain-containing protein n=1 Tax=Hirsutella minnesotensis 3608 TaxID=1043627 RepID=A0A0F7ZFB3_9HYPO|nr:hypothetical protein HIM_11771 [Hirsutella minnesotensis 3608]
MSWIRHLIPLLAFPPSPTSISSSRVDDPPLKGAQGLLAPSHKVVRFLGCVAAVPVLASPLPAPIAPGIPSSNTARTLLNGLEIAEPGSSDGYSRKEFPHWGPVSGTCNTREFVLKRDGVDVRTDRACRSVSGSWTSLYDGVTVTEARDIDIDHMVPLHNAWISGASSWTLEKRTAFANDITGPQLWAVSTVNREKSDSSPDKWAPPLTDFHCTYAKSWDQVKSYHKLAVTDAEMGALSNMLDSC